MKLSDFNLLNDEYEKETLKNTIESFNQTASQYPRDKTVHAIFSEQARKTPHAIAVMSGQGVLTYADVEQRSNQLAHFLLSFNLPVEALIGVMLDRSPDTIIVLLAVLKTGAAYLPLNYELPVIRLQYLLSDTHAQVLITCRQQQKIAEKLQQESTQAITLFFIDGDTELDSAQKNTFDCKILNTYPVSSPAVYGNGNNLAYIMYTSGSTGQPKGVMIEHQSISRLVLNTNYINIKPSDCILQTGSLSFDASTFEIWGALLNGAVYCCLSEFSLLDPKKLKHFINDYQVTIIFFTTSLFNQLVDIDIEIFSALKQLLTGGEKASRYHINKIKAAYPDLRVIHCYGPTENTTFSTCHNVEIFHTDDIPIGKPVANTQVLILDTNNQLVQIGVVGEICLAGDGLARGYLNNPKLTQEKFFQHPFDANQFLYRTGDLGLWYPDGAIKFIGRKDGQVKIRGYRIELSEIENHLLQHEAVKEAVVIAKDLGADSKELWAYITLKTALTSLELRNYLKVRLPDYMIPAYFTVLDKLPLNTNGKIDKNALPTSNTSKINDIDYQAPTTETEQELVLIWEEILAHKGIGVTDNFFDIGGHSLKITKMAALIKQRLEVNMPLSALFNAPTIRQLSQTILDTTNFNYQEIDQAMLLLNGVTDGHKLFAFPPGTGDAIGFVQLAGYLNGYSFYSFNFLEADSRIKDYADLIVEADAIGPYRLLGYSAGGNVAYHVAYELEKRGKQVLDIIMIDSAQHSERLNYPQEEVQKTIAEYINHESMKPYLHNSVLRDKAARLIQRYHDYFSKTVDDCIVNANIHVLLGENSQDVYYSDDPEIRPLLTDAGGAKKRVVLSISGWRNLTLGAFKTYQGMGDHNLLLIEPYLKGNAEIVRKIIEF